MKKRIQTVITLLLLTGVISTLQAQNFAWLHQLKGFYEEIKTDASGNVYVTGNFYGTYDFDPGTGVTELISQGNYDVFVAKYDASGNLLNAKSFGGSSSDIGKTLQIDANGNVYISGTFNGTADFDPGSAIVNATSMGMEDIFVLKLDDQLDYVWSHTIGGSLADFSNKIAVKNDKVIVVGAFTGTVDFDPTSAVDNYTSVGTRDGYALCLNATNGNYEWTRTYGGNAFNQSESIVIDNSNEIYVTGRFSGTYDFDPSAQTADLTSYGTNSFVVKYDASGNFLWVKGLITTTFSNCYSLDMTVDASNNLYITGEFIGTADFDPSGNTATLSSLNMSYSNAFVCKWDNSGTFIWTKQLSGYGSFGRNITMSNSGNVVTSGDFLGLVDFDPSSNVIELDGTSYKAYISILDQNGNYVWADAFGGTGYDFNYALCVDNSDNIYIAGEFENTVDFNNGPGINEFTRADGEGFLLKLSDCSAATGVDIQTACGTFDWIDGITYTSSNSIATHTIAGGASSGCDSIVTLNLTINTVDVSVNITGTSLTASATNANYQWVDCNNSNSAISGETNSTFTPIANGSYAVTVTQNGCTETSSCQIINSVSIETIEQEIISVYPNPAQGFLQIKLNQPSDLKIYNSLGMLIQTETKFYGGALNVSNLPNGLFFIVSEKGQSVSFVKQ